MAAIAAPAIIMTCMNTAAVAGAITVAPVRIELTPLRPIATLDVRNEGDDVVTVQIEKLDWAQFDGNDTYTASSALLATPSIFELAPHATQTLRVALRAAGTDRGERAFRLYAAEVPPDNPPDPGLHMALRIGIPVFVEPTAGSPRLMSELSPLASGKRALRIRNTGTRFTRVLSLDLQNLKGTTLWHDAHPAYLLAGGEHVWQIDANEVEQAAAERLQLSIVTEDGQRIDTSLGP